MSMGDGKVEYESGQEAKERALWAQEASIDRMDPGLVVVMVEVVLL
jgi:hypothetical protein